MRWAFYSAATNFATPGLVKRMRQDSNLHLLAETTPKYRPPTTPNIKKRFPDGATGTSHLVLPYQFPAQYQAVSLRESNPRQDLSGGEVRLAYDTHLKIREKSAGVQSEKRRPKPFCSTRLSYKLLWKSKGRLVRFERTTRRNAFRRHPAGAISGRNH